MTTAGAPAHGAATAPASARCAVAALARGDALVATALPQSLFLLVEDPGPWGTEPHPIGSLPIETATHLRRWSRAHGARLLLVRRHGRRESDRRHESHGRHDTERARTWALADVRAGTLRVGTAYDDALASLDPAASGEREHRPWFLVCTHGRHDVCCAIEGRPVAHALESQAGDRVWECTHVGGDRFAANVLCLPSGAMYGQVGVDDAERLVALDSDGRLLLDNLRGRAGRPAAAQSAEDAVRRHHGLDGVDDVNALRWRETGRRRWAVEVEARNVGVQQVLVWATPAAAVERVSCAASEPRQLLLWRAEVTGPA